MTRMEELDALIAAAPKRTRREYCKEYERLQVHAALWLSSERELAHRISEGNYERFLVEQAEHTANNS